MIKTPVSAAGVSFVPQLAETVYPVTSSFTVCAFLLQRGQSLPPSPVEPRCAVLPQRREASLLAEGLLYPTCVLPHIKSTDWVATPSTRAR
jgi:hypothetical protein